MTWLAAIGLAAATFALAAFVLRVKKSGWTLLAAALLFGLTGYALQGSPGQPASPGAAVEKPTLDGELLVAARREYFTDPQLPSRWIITGDGYARRGDFSQAAAFYRSATEENPRDLEAWLALGIALVEHAEGNLTPAALYAFEQAQELDESNGGGRYFLGLSWLRAGEAERAVQLWREALANAPKDADWRDSLALRLMRLEAMLAPADADNAPDTRD